MVKFGELDIGAHFKTETGTVWQKVDLDGAIPDDDEEGEESVFFLLWTEVQPV